MKPTLFLRLASASLLLLLATRVAQAAESGAESEQRLRDSVTYLSSDELEGRGVGTEGLNKAAQYLASEFTKLGLKTDLFEGTPFQEFTVNVTVEMGPTAENVLALVGPKDVKPERFDLKLGESFNPLASGGTGQFDVPLVFAGYGITAKELKRGDQTFSYDDYAGIDAKGKVIVILRKEPQQKDPKSPFGGEKTTQHAYFQQKLRNAVEHGAVAVILVNDAPELTSRKEEGTKVINQQLEKLTELRDKFRGASAEEQAKLAASIQKSAEQVVEFSKRLAGSTDTLLPFHGAGDETSHPKLPVLFCTREAIDNVLKAAGQKDLATREQEIDADLTPRSVELAGWKAVGQTHVIQKKADVKNVIAVLEGAGPHADETIVIGAHYDHLGMGGAGSLAPWTTDIHNGADDNASGTATLLELARRLTASGQKPKHRIVFMAFTGEERGLLGSAHYVRNPRFPLESTIAMFNLDMVGRLKDDKLMVYGTGTAQEFDPLVESLCQKYGFKLTKHPGGFGPSDHSSFYGKKIPVLHLFTGTHSDYHRPSDDAPKLNIEGMRRVTDMLLDVVQSTDEASQRPTYIEMKKVEQIAGSGDSSDRPYFGSMPAYPNPETDGVLLEAVSENSPAAQAGLKGGDVLQQIGTGKILTLEDFQAVLSNYKPGDRVKVKVRRGDQSLDLEATLQRRGMP